MRLIIIGASGLIGKSLYEAARASGIVTIGTYNNNKVEGLTHFNMEAQSLRSVISDLGTKDVVYVLSAYSNPSWIFDNQEKAKNLNLYATKRLIDEILEVGARVIFMSSVEVFDGISGNYDETSLPKPLNLYGKMKFEIEQYLNKKGGQSCIVRTGWNVGWTLENRCVIKLTYETLLRPGAKMAKDNNFSIVDVKDTAAGLLKIADKPDLRVCHLASAPPIFRTELADTIISLSKNKDMMKYRVAMFSDIPYSEPRACCNSLAVSKLKMKFRAPVEIIKQKVKLLDGKLNI